jgi:hypothetical protein
MPGGASLPKFRFARPYHLRSKMSRPAGQSDWGEPQLGKQRKFLFRFLSHKDGAPSFSTGLI